MRIVAFHHPQDFLLLVTPKSKNLGVRLCEGLVKIYGVPGPIPLAGERRFVHENMRDVDLCNPPSNK